MMCKACNQMIIYQLKTGLWVHLRGGDPICESGKTEAEPF